MKSKFYIIRKDIYFIPNFMRKENLFEILRGKNVSIRNICRFFFGIFYEKIIFIRNLIKKKCPISKIFNKNKICQKIKSFT